jgi:hypothetical protein
MGFLATALIEFIDLLQTQLFLLGGVGGGLLDPYPFGTFTNARGI